MKHIITIIALISLFSCKAQSVIVPIGSGEDFQKNPNYYVKDVNNEFGKFEGIWKYQNGNTSIIFKLKKEEHYQVSETSNYLDLLVGEYQYIENGVEKVNTLADFDNPSISGYNHKISGRVFTHNIPNICIDNSHSSEIKIELMIESPGDHLIEGRVILRYVNENGTEKLEVCIYDYSILQTMKMIELTYRMVIMSL
ncbi:MAG: hypothetical protein GKR88_10310 [Flavobacteriaceae bacterium]|nr:MAG: hypothetical protein GKR88_10310 [Flavobacteriaceae bacterium]